MLCFCSGRFGSRPKDTGLAIGCFWKAVWRLDLRPGSLGLRRAGIWTAIGGAACDVLLCRCWERLPPSATFTDGREGSIKSHKEFDCESTRLNFLHSIHNLSLSLYSRSCIYSRIEQTHCFPILKGVAPGQTWFLLVAKFVVLPARNNPKDSYNIKSQDARVRESRATYCCSFHDSGCRLKRCLSSSHERSYLALLLRLLVPQVSGSHSMLLAHLLLRS